MALAKHPKCQKYADAGRKSNYEYPMHSIFRARPNQRIHSDSGQNGYGKPQRHERLMPINRLN